MTPSAFDPAEVSALAEHVREGAEAGGSRSVAGLRPLRRQVSRQVEGWSGEACLALAGVLLERERGVPRWFTYELVHHHADALDLLDAERLRRLGAGLSSWGDVDPFACYLGGVAWRRGQIGDAEVLAWARSESRWWRRVALVSTVPLNNRARGGTGDATRTLMICDALIGDRDDLVVKACSWALRELAVRDPVAVAGYLAEHGEVLPARVVREVRRKLETGRKNPGSATR